MASTSNKKRIVLRSGGGMRRYSRPTVLRLDFLAVNLVSCSCPSSLRIKVIGLPLLFSAHITAMMDEGELIWQMEICTVTTACLTSATTAACLRTTVSTHWCWRHTLENIITIMAILMYTLSYRCYSIIVPYLKVQLYNRGLLWSLLNLNKVSMLFFYRSISKI